MSALIQSRTASGEITPIEINPEAVSAPHGNNARFDERTLLVLDSRPLDGQCLARCIATRKGELDAVWFSSMSEWRRRQAPRRFGAVLINIGDKDIASHAIAAEIKAIKAALNIPVIVMSDSESLTDIVTALELGVSGYIPTSVNLDICIEAVALAMAGGVFVPASSVMSMRQKLCEGTDVVRPLNEMFTVRQAQVIEALRRGKANKIIAFELSMQESTVKVHIRSIMRKVKATNRTEVVYKINDMFPQATLMAG